ncbi:MAG: chemotaxis protein CheW [Oscillospiraceae bacterium]|nr:chemotaxis protein CheW [Oscillospiraceae bacterium]
MEITTDYAATANEMPWLVFKLKDQHFAVNSSNIVTIFQIEQNVTKVPEYPENVRGIINLRGDVVPLLELRRVLGMPLFKEEQQSFYDMLEQRKNDHIAWVSELKRCLKNDEKFTLATDHHKCAFGKWYDTYKTDNATVQFHLNKIDEPHKNLHAIAKQAIECPRDCANCTRTECLQKLVAKASEEYMPIVVNLLEEAKTVFQDSYREMCVVVTNGETVLGLLVDEVNAVQALSPVGTADNLNGIYKSSLVSHVAKSENIDGEILVLNEAQLFTSIA